MTVDTNATSLKCSRHRDTPARMRCDRCDRPFCRDCLVSRFITSRSSVWLCRSCAGIRGAGIRGAGIRGAGSWSGGLIPHPRSAGGRSAGYWWAALAFAGLVLYGAFRQGLLGL